MRLGAKSTVQLAFEGSTLLRFNFFNSFTMSQRTKWVYTHGRLLNQARFVCSELVFWGRRFCRRFGKRLSKRPYR